MEEPTVNPLRALFGPRPPIDMTGKTCGVVVVLERAPSRGVGAEWLCRCTLCGGTRVIVGGTLRTKAPKTCLGRCRREGAR